MGFKEIALPLAAKGVPTVPVLPNSKKAFITGWDDAATTSEEQIVRWDAMYPGYNGAAVAKGDPNGVWFFEIDSIDVISRIKAETGNDMPDTYRVRSRENRGHFYFRNTPESMEMGNIAQGPNIKHGDWSARVRNAYVVAAGSIHPHSKEPYTAISNDLPILPAPNWLIEWLKSQRVSASSLVKTEPARDVFGLIPHGQIHGYMLHHAGKLRAMGLEADAIEVALLDLVHKNCAPPIDDQRVVAMAHSVCKSFPAGQSTELILTQQAAPAPPPPPDELEELPVFDEYSYPKFPHWVMEGTSLYENYVKPVCEQNSRIDYFMWLPAMVMLLNYVGPKIKIKEAFGLRPFKGSIYMVLIGKKGKTNKSSSVVDGMNYFNYIGLLSHAGRDTKNAESRILSWTSGSTEGLGISMQRTQCKNALLWYDELSMLVQKAGIDNSSLNSNLLTMYESGKFENSVKSTKESFSLDPDTYCTSLIAATTDKKFAELWSRLAGSDTGLDDRFMFVLQPDPLPQPRLQNFVNTVLGSVQTKQLIDKVVAKGEIAFEDREHPQLQALAMIENRYANRAEKWALALAIDLGLDEIDGECIERACKIVEYEIAVKQYLNSYEATTKEGQLQQSIRRELEMHKGRMAKRELYRDLNADRHGTTLWNQAYIGLIKNGFIREEGTGKRGDIAYVQLLIKREVGEE